jgi:hypothetical protein
MRKSLLALIFLSLTSESALASEPYCPFAYQKVMRELVQPELDRKLKERASELDVGDPLLFQSRQTLQVILQAGRSENGGMPLDTDNFIVTIDTCTFKVIESHFESSSPTRHSAK